MWKRPIEDLVAGTLLAPFHCQVAMRIGSKISLSYRFPDPQKCPDRDLIIDPLTGAGESGSKR